MAAELSAAEALAVRLVAAQPAKMPAPTTRETVAMSFLVNMGDLQSEC
jgi:hypothetical protein